MRPRRRECETARLDTYVLQARREIKNVFFVFFFFFRFPEFLYGGERDSST